MFPSVPKEASKLFFSSQAVAYFLSLGVAARVDCTLVGLLEGLGR